MKIKFLGTSAAEGIPAIFCNCEFCSMLRKRGGKARTRTQIIIDDKISIDFPPDAYFHSIRERFDMSRISDIIVTHSHMDHFYAHDFILHGYKYSRNYVSQTITIHGNSEVMAVFKEDTRRELKDEIASSLILHEVSPFEKFSICDGDYYISTLKARHSKTEDALLYVIEGGGKTLFHLCDTGRLFDENYEFLKNSSLVADAVIFDCTFLDTRSGEDLRHMGIEDNMIVKNRLKEIGAIREDTKFFITHFSHNSCPSDEKLKMLSRKYGVIPAYDGFEIEI